MELVGIVIWPVIGLIYIIYKLFQEQSDIAHGLFGLKSVGCIIAICGSCLCLKFVGEAIVNHTSEVVAKVLLTICLIVYIAAIFIVVFVLANPKITSKLRQRKDPAWQAMLRLPVPTDAELDAEIKRTDEELGFNALPKYNRLYVDESCYDNPKYMQKRRELKIKLWRIDQYQRICKEMGRTPDPKTFLHS